MRALATIEPERAYSPKQRALVPRTLLVAAISADPLRENRCPPQPGFRKEKPRRLTGLFLTHYERSPRATFWGDGGRRGGARIKRAATK